MRRRKKPGVAAVLALCFGGFAFFYFGLWTGLATSAVGWVLYWLAINVIPGAGDLAGLWVLVINLGFAVAAVWMCAQHNRKLPPEPLKPTPQKSAWPSLRKYVIFAVCWFVADAFILNQGFASALLLIIVIAALPWALWSAVRKHWPEFRSRMAQIGILGAAACAVLAVVSLQNVMAQRRAIRLGDACRQFHAKYNRYPARLEELEPEFIGSVPVAKYSLINPDFLYIRSDDDPKIFYVEVPPFGRRFYHVKSGKWGYMD